MTDIYKPSVTFRNCYLILINCQHMVFQLLMPLICQKICIFASESIENYYFK